VSVTRRGPAVDAHFDGWHHRLRWILRRPPVTEGTPTLSKSSRVEPQVNSADGEVSREGTTFVQVDAGRNRTRGGMAHGQTEADTGAVSGEEADSTA
jgi:hypothetical protein